MKRRAAAAVVSCWLLGCTATTELDNLDSGATSSSSAASTSASSATVGSGGGGGSAGAGGNGGAAGCDYAAQVLADTPVGYWRLDELVTPDAYDATLNGNDGLYVLGVTLGVPGAFAQSGTAAQLDGTGRVDLGDRFDFPGTASFSLEAWVNPGDGGTGALLGKFDYLGMEYVGYNLYVSASGPVSFSRRPGGLAQASSLRPNVFTHVVAAYDGVTMRLYIDGAVQDNQDHMGAIADVASPFFIGDAASWANFNGTMDEVAVYDYALAPTQISDHYTCALGVR